MKYIVSWVAFLFLFLVVLPLTLSTVFKRETDNERRPYSNEKVTVFFHDTNTKKVMSMDEYLIGVVMAEMPASFEKEALKAQAVAARTYTVNKIVENTASKTHNGADICTDSSHCQAYISEKDAKKNWGKNASEYFKKCKNSVLDTSDEIMLYEDEPVKAVFHSSSSGRTENAKDIWGGDVPYLVSVESPGETLSPSHKSEVVKSIDEFKKIILENHKVDFSKNLVGDITRTDAGAVKSIEIGNKTFKGTQIRSMFGLRSACFDITRDGDCITFEVTGNGHGVGMSQYGANYLASIGYDYKDILKRYYTGVSFGTIK